MQLRKSSSARRWRGRLLAAAAFGAFSLPAAADGESIDLQLNAAKASEEGCRLSFVLHNKLRQRIEDLAFEVVLFDAEDSVSEFLLLKAGSLPAGKRKVRQFDLKGHACGAISQVLVNDVTVCTGTDLTAAGCLDLLRPSSATEIKLVM